MMIFFFTEAWHASAAGKSRHAEAGIDRQKTSWNPNMTLVLIGKQNALCFGAVFFGAALPKKIRGPLK